MITKDEEKLLKTVKSAPIFGLGKWRREHGLIDEKWAAYVNAMAIKTMFFVLLAFFIGYSLGSLGRV